MSGKPFVFLLIIVALVIGVAVIALLDDSNEPAGPARPADGGAGAEVEQARPAVADPEIASPGPEIVQPGPERESAADPGEYDPGGVLVIQGKVTAAKDGEALADAEVELLYEDGSEVDSATTDEEGRYRIELREGVPPVIDLKAWADGYATEPRRGVKVGAGSRDITVDFELRSWFTIEGRITSAVDGLPVEGADIEIRSLLPMYEDEWDDGTSDANGFYRIEEIEDLPRHNIDVWVDSTSHAPMVKSGLSVPEGSDVLKLDFVLWPRLVLRGTVVSGLNGDPIEDAEVSASSRDPEFVDDGEDEVTDEDGTFELELDAVPFEDLFVLVSAEGHAGYVVERIPPPDRNGVIELGRIALPPPITLVGTVLSRPGGTPVKGGDVAVYAQGAPEREDGDFTDMELIDEAGRFELEFEYAPGGKVEVFIDADGHFPARFPLELPQNMPRHEMRFEVEPILTMKGMVRREADDTPVAGAKIRLLAPVEGAESIVGRSLADGRYQIELPAGDTTRFGVVVEFAGKRFPQGELKRPASSQRELLKDFVIDIPPMPRRKP